MLRKILVSLCLTCILSLGAYSLSFADNSSEQSVVSKNKIEIYGFLKLDASLDDSKTDNPDAPKYARSEATTENESQFAMTAMNSRFGLKYYDTESFEVEVYGNLELDFYDTASDNSQKPRMRHAFFELRYPNWNLLAGQTWDIFGPLGPNTLNTNGYLWYGGNIGFRRPQIRLTNTFGLPNASKVTTQLSLNRNIGITDGSTTANSGENSGHPLLEGRIAYTFPFLYNASTIGIAGLYGQEEFNRNTTTESSYKVPAWAGGIDYLVPVTSKLSLKGEFFYGSNLDGLLAGIGYGINESNEEGVGTIGGWAQFAYKVNSDYSLNLGYGIDNPENGDLNNGDRSKNQVIFANVIHSIRDDVKLGLEYSNFITEYLNSERGSNKRVTVSLTYNF